MTTSPIFQTRLKNDGAVVNVTIEDNDNVSVLIVREAVTGVLVLATYVALATEAVVGSVLDSIDTAAVLSRLAETR